MDLHLKHVISEGAISLEFDVANKLDVMWVEFYFALRFGHMGVMLSTGLYGDGSVGDWEGSRFYFDPSCTTYDLGDCFFRSDTWTFRRAVIRKERGIAV